MKRNIDRKKSKTCVINLRIHKDLKEKFLKYAKDNKKTMTDIISKLLEEKLSKK